MNIDRHGAHLPEQHERLPEATSAIDSDCLGTATGELRGGAAVASSPVLEAEADINYQDQAQSAQNLSTLNRGIIERLAFINERFGDLKALEMKAQPSIRKTMESLPSFTLIYLVPGYQLGCYLCIDEAQSQIPATLRERMGQVVDTAELNVVKFR